jgi:dinuclear metal center YbgI/SA1388 family protein
MKMESIVEYMDRYLSIGGHPDYRLAYNGIQVEGTRDVSRIGAAVDASIATIEAAVAADVDLLLVHHGLFWGGSAPLTGPLYKRVRPLMLAGLGLYSAHLPLDAHPEVGNCALLARALELRDLERFGSYEGVEVGWRGQTPEPVEPSALASALGDVLGVGVHLIGGGPTEVRSVGVVTGGGASFLRDAAELGLDALVTGEGPHHTFIDAMELGVNVLFGGHYATETFGVRALAQHVADRFDLEWQFLDHPSGL